MNGGRTDPLVRKFARPCPLSQTQMKSFDTKAVQFPWRQLNKTTTDCVAWDVKDGKQRESPEIRCDRSGQTRTLYFGRKCIQWNRTDVHATRPRTQISRTRYAFREFNFCHLKSFSKELYTFMKGFMFVLLQLSFPFACPWKNFLMLGLCEHSGLITLILG